MKSVAFIALAALIGASLMTVVFFPLCMLVTASSYCMPPIDWLLPVLAFLGSEGGASGVFGAIWVAYFIGLCGLLTFLTLLRRRGPN